MVNDEHSFVLVMQDKIQILEHQRQLTQFSMHILQQILYMRRILWFSYVRYILSIIIGTFIFILFFNIITFVAVFDLFRIYSDILRFTIRSDSLSDDK